MSKQLDRNPIFSKALDLMENGKPFVFITGRAGTGKSTLLRTFREESSLVFPVLAPTGVAALNVGGETIHRFFRFAPGMSMKDAKRRGFSRREDPLLNKIDGFIIDEISMVRADLLDCMDVFLQAALGTPAPFGGKRIIAIGDLAQLPPVLTRHEQEAFLKAYETPYFFSARGTQTLLATSQVDFIELETVYRQTDPEFIRLLNSIRDQRPEKEDLQAINARFGKVHAKQDHDIILTTTNDQADRINQEHLSAINKPAFTYNAIMDGDFQVKDAPTDEALVLKQGARVMCIANDIGGSYVNGSLGTIKDLDELTVTVELDNETTVTLGTHAWTLFQSKYDEDTHTLVQEKLGSFAQIPLRLAWAVTIHKSQGKTFDKLIIDLERGAFAHGQIYVALSRCRSLEGITLTKPIQSHHIHADHSVGEFLTCLREQRPFLLKGQTSLI
ncbi:AAA family ATPase [Patescibacteria group bacterium]|nr:AAA family ATPase [Patescibacteria group bacterium]MBP9709987.1 AAA family ATPase [Patescibacteria group bacterium]